VSTMSAQRLVSDDVLSEVLAPDGVSGALSTTSATLVAREVGGDVSGEASGEITRGVVTAEVEVGLWEAGPGTDVDVEADEVFLVLTGAGAVRFADGSAIDLRPGVLVRLYEGDRTTWVVTERLRKLYLA
jgi:uncharacterized protein